MIAASAILHSMVQDQILPKRVLVYNPTRNAMKQILSITPSKSACLLLLGWPDGRAEMPHFALSTTHMHFPATLSFLTTATTTSPSLEKSPQPRNHEIHFAPKSHP